VARVSTDPVGRIAAEVTAREPIRGIRIVGVDGPSGAGKSHLTTRLAARLSAPVVAVDDFVSWGNVTGWWPRFDAQVLTPLLAGRDAVWQARDWTDWYGDALGEWKTLRWSPTVIIEGVTCTRRETVGRLCYAVWVEAPAGVRRARGLARDRGFAGAAELWDRWMREEDAFFAADGTRARADIVVDTSG
jgi:uridine kinase